MGLLFFSCRVVKVKAMNNARHVGNYNNVYIYVRNVFVFTFERTYFD